MTREEPPTPATLPAPPPQPAPAVAVSPPPPQPSPPTAEASRPPRPDPGQGGPAADAMLSRGHGLLAVGDVSGARLMFERAARGGNAAAALAMGRTFDEAFLGRLRVRMPPDQGAALEWYRRAASLGSTEAGALISQTPGRGAR